MPAPDESAAAAPQGQGAGPGALNSPCPSGQMRVCDPPGKKGGGAVICNKTSFSQCFAKAGTTNAKDGPLRSRWLRTFGCIFGGGGG